MSKKKHDDHAGGHGWFVTFADLMSLLMSFFVILAAFSSQDKEKMKAIAGSMRDAFGVQDRPSQAAVIEVDGIPVRSATKNVAHVDPQDSTIRPGPASGKITPGVHNTSHELRFASAAATLRQALQDLPDVAELSRQIMIEERPDGLALQLVDQDGRSMFAEGSKQPYERTRRALMALAPTIAHLPYRLTITGHTSASTVATSPAYSAWELSADRANAVRALLAAGGVSKDRFFSVVGRADTEPMFPDDPYLAANRRITVLLMDEAPPIPMDAKP
jgi:chemotaxis protein MotB